MGHYELAIDIIGRDKASSAFRSASRGLGRIGEIASGVIGAHIFLGLADDIGRLAQAAFNATAQFQAMEVGLQGLVARELSQLTDGVMTVEQVFPQAQQAAKGLMEELSKMAILSPFTVESVQQTFRMNMAFGYTTEQAKKVTDGLLNMAAGIGASNDMLDRMAYNFAQIRLQGKVTALDIRQLALAGFDLNSVLKFTGRQMGIDIKTHLDFNKAIADGKITWEDFVTSFQKYAEVNFAGASERMARTLMGLKSTWHDVFVLTMPKVIGPAAESFTETVNKMLNIFIRLRETDILTGWGDKLKTKVDELFGPFNKLFDFILKYMDLGAQLKANNLPADVMQRIREEMQRMLPSGDLLAEALRVAFGEKAVFALNLVRMGLGFITKGFQTFLTVIRALWPVVETLLGGFNTFVQKFGPGILDSIGRILGAFLGLGKEGAQNGLGLLMGVAQQFADWIGGEGGAAIADWISKAADWIIQNLIPAVRQLVTWFQTNIPVALAAVSNFWNNTLQPALQSLWAWLSTYIPPVITALGNLWNTVLLPAFQWLANILVTVVIPALGQLITWIAANLPTAIAFLGQVWNTILLPALQFLANLLVTYVFPLLTQLWNWLGTTIPQVIAFFVGAWNTIGTVISTVWMVIQPIIMLIINILGTVLTPVIQILGSVFEFLGAVVATVWNAISGVIIPIASLVAQVIIAVVVGAVQIFIAVLTQVWALISGLVMPIINTLATFLSSVFKLAWTFVITVINLFIEVLKKGVEWLQKIWEKVGGVKGILDEVQKFIKETVEPALQGLVDGVLKGLSDAFGGISSAISTALGWIGDLIEKLGSIKLPDWLTPGSPTPFEMGIRGISSAVKELSKTSLPMMNMQLAASLQPTFPTPNGARGSYGGVQSGAIVVDVHDFTMSNELDVEETFRYIADRLRYEKRVRDQR